MSILISEMYVSGRHSGLSRKALELVLGFEDTDALEVEFQRATMAHEPLIPINCRSSIRDEQNKLPILKMKLKRGLTSAMAQRAVDVPQYNACQGVIKGARTLLELTDRVTTWVESKSELREFFPDELWDFLNEPEPLPDEGDTPF